MKDIRNTIAFILIALLMMCGDGIADLLFGAMPM